MKKTVSTEASSLINYDHSANAHSLSGPKHAFMEIFGKAIPESILDVGCGTGTWLKAALDSGVSDVIGVDGIQVSEDKFLVSPECFKVQDLTKSWDLGRRFDAAICMEVAEHLPKESSKALVQGLIKHSDKILFSAAAPNQPGQHHINCQWPTFWQELFNSHGYVCSDSVRWRIWSNDSIEWWYRQNVFLATLDKNNAGKEARIRHVVHPQMLRAVISETINESFPIHADQIANGRQSLVWYLTICIRALTCKLRRRVLR